MSACRTEGGEFMAFVFKDVNLDLALTLTASLYGFACQVGLKIA